MMKAFSFLPGWLRELTTHFAPALLPAWRALRWKGIYLCLCAWPLRWVPFPVVIPGLGALRNREEACNFLGNFCTGELRSEEVELHLQKTPDALVVDIGVNVGMTVRHWLMIAPHARVLGLDMMQEALDFTSQRLQEQGRANSFTGICGAVTDHRGEITLHFDDALSGTNSLGAEGQQQRTVHAATLDEWIKVDELREIALIKLDVEGHGAKVLAGSSLALQKARFLVLEFHSREELEQSSQILFQAGWMLFSVQGRNLWWHHQTVEKITT
jgi:FkbM family methyltransferase